MKTELCGQTEIFTPLRDFCAQLGVFTDHLGRRINRRVYMESARTPRDAGKHAPVLFGRVLLSSIPESLPSVRSFSSSR